MKLHEHNEAGAPKANEWVDEVLAETTAQVERGQLNGKDRQEIDAFLLDELDRTLDHMNKTDRPWFVHDALEAIFPGGELSPEHMSGKLGGSTLRGRIATRLLDILAPRLESVSDTFGDMEGMVLNLAHDAKDKVREAMRAQQDRSILEARAVPHKISDRRRSA